MPIINPSINISVGSYGEEYIASFYNYFLDNEPGFRDYSSFYKCGFSSNAIYFNALDDKQETHGLNIDDNISRKDLLEELRNDDAIYFLKNSIYNAYIDLVNLINQLQSNINYNIVNINIIASSFEENCTVLLYQIVEQINILNKSGAISNVSIKVFTVISKNRDLLNTKEQIVTYQNLEEIKTIYSKFDSVLHNVIFIDNQNTSTVFLNINNESIGFVLNEFITYLMTNHYNMIGNLFEANFISLGLGTLIFDKKFFHLFFRSRIIDKLVKAEQISDDIEHKFDTAGYSRLRDDVFYPFFKNEKDVGFVLSELKSKVFPTKYSNTLLEYQFLLSNLLGKHDDINLKQPLTNAEKISLDDIILKVLSADKSITSGQDIDILKYKHRLDEKAHLNIKVEELRKNEKEKAQLKIDRLEEKLNTKHTELEKVFDEESIRESLENEIAEILETIDLLKQNIEENNYDNNELKSLEDRLTNIVILTNLEEGIIKETIRLFEDGKVQVGAMKSKEEIDNNILELQNKKSEFEEERNRSCFKKFFKPNLKREIDELDSQISNCKSNLQNVEAIFKNADTNSKPFYELKKQLEKLYNDLNTSTDRIKRIQIDLNAEFNNANLLNYRFIKHVIDVDILEKYFEKNSENFLDNFPSLFDKIQQINSKDIKLSEKENELTVYLNSILTDSVNEIIDFNIVNYMNGDYDKLNLLKSESIDSIIQDLLNTAKPFFNSVNSYNTNNSHRLMLHNKDIYNSDDVNNLHKSMETCFTATIPQHINTINVNKFSIIKIDVIDDFTSIVKYNESKKVYEEKGSDTIIIK